MRRQAILLITMRSETGNSYKNILCIRADNMGDLLMSSPAIRALKETFNGKITVLTSSMASEIAGYIAEIDDILVFDFPWIKNEKTFLSEDFFKIVDEIKKLQFDAAIIFTVYSQNPLPAAMLIYLAEIPVRLAYCRENPYSLLSLWIPDKEPYSFIRHQVRRDLDLVAHLKATTENEALHLKSSKHNWTELQDKLALLNVNLNKPWLIIHPGVSEKKGNTLKSYGLKPVKN